jgi:hypothetical protein
MALQCTVHGVVDTLDRAWIEANYRRREQFQRRARTLSVGGDVAWAKATLFAPAYVPSVGFQADNRRVLLGCHLATGHGERAASNRVGFRKDVDSGDAHLTLQHAEEAL